MELIYKDKLLEAIDNCDYCDHCSLSICLCIGDNFRTEKAIVNLIKDTPAVDAVEVVRCKDCENLTEQTMEIFGEEHRWCRFHGWRTDDWYCADGKKERGGMMELKTCPFCGAHIRIVACDDEGNLRDDDYENNPWSGIGYRIYHVITDDLSNSCPIARHEGEGEIGIWIYDSKSEAIEAWNRRANGEQKEVQDENT